MTAATRRATAPPAVPRVAVVGPFTGPRAAWGELLADGVAALRHLPVMWELLDDRGDAREAAARAREVVADGGFAAVAGHFNSQGARAALPAYRDAGLAVVLPLATSPGLLDGMAGTALRLCPDDDDQARAIVAACLAEGHRRLVVADDGSAYGRRLASGVLAAAGAQPAVTAAPTTWPPPDGVATVVCGVHHAVARLLASGGRRAGAVVVTDDCDVPEFAQLLAGTVPGVRAVGLAGGARPRVTAALAALGAALEKHPERRGPALLESVRAEVPDGLGTGGGEWTLAPLPAPARPRTRGAADVAVVGGGVVGLATACELAERGARVVLVDAGDGQAASTVSGGLVRAFEPDPAARRLALRSFELLWGRPDVAPAHGLHRTGSLVLLGEAHLGTAADGVAELRRAGVRADLLTVAELGHRWPHLRLDGLAGAVWEPDAGYAVPALAVAALRERAERAGVPFVRGRVARLPGAGNVRLEGLLDADVAARVVVVAAGCGATALLGERWPGDRPARTRRIRYAVLAAPTGPGRAAVPALVDLTTGLWARPDGRDGVLAGRPVPEWDVPVRAGTGLAAPEIDWIREGMAARLPALAGAPALTGRFGTDLYTATGPVVGAVPGMPRAVLAAAWSGGGFKTAPAAGELAADAACAALAGQPDRQGDSDADTTD